MIMMYNKFSESFLFYYSFRTQAYIQEYQEYKMTTAKTPLTDFVVPSYPLPPPAVAERIQKQPECRLLWAILQDGIESYMKYAFASSRRGKRLFAETEQWIMQDDHTWLCSFVSICHTLGLEPDYLRSGLKRWRAQGGQVSLKQAA